MEDLNYLFHRQLEERSRACPKAREAHETLAEFCEKRILNLTCGQIKLPPRPHIRSANGETRLALAGHSHFPPL